MSICKSVGASARALADSAANRGGGLTNVRILVINENGIDAQMR